MAKRVFFSHSQYDYNIKNYFYNIFRYIGIEGIFFEWQRRYENDYAGETITKLIQDRATLAVFVLLGRSVQNPPSSTPRYTHNWISFEVGLAAGSMKPVGVFEEFGASILFPVPYVTDYAQYTIQNLEHLQYYGEIFLDRIKNQTYQIRETFDFRCEYTDCNARYRCWSISESFNCPVCRRHIPKEIRTGFSKPPGFPSNVVGVHRLLQQFIRLGSYKKTKIC